MAVDSTTPGDLARLAQFLNGLDELALETGFRVGVGSEVLDLRRLLDPATDLSVSACTLQAKIVVDETPGPALGELQVRHSMKWG